MKGLTLLAALAALATTFVNRPLSEAVSEVPNIVRGKTGDSYSNWTKDQTRIYTYYHFTIIEALKGDLKPGARILLRSPGGSKNGTEMHVPGAAQFVPDEDVVVLLSAHNAEDDSYDIPGFTTGKYNVRTGPNGEPMLVNSLGSAAIYDPRKDPKTLSYNSSIPLEVFRRVAKGEDVPEAAHRQFEQSKKEAPAGAFEAGHRHAEIRTLDQKATAPSPAIEAPKVKSPAPRSMAGLWVPLSFGVLALGIGYFSWRLMRSKDS